VLAVVGAVLWFLLDDPAARGPLIKGKPVAYWTRQLLHPVPPYPDAMSTLANEKSVAIPALVHQLSLPDVAAKDFAKKLWLWLPGPLQARVPAPITRAELRAGAVLALAMIYEPLTIHTHAPSRPSLSEAQIMLPALTKALQDREAVVRIFAAGALGSLAVISTQAIDSCDAALKDPNWNVRANAVSSLGRLALTDEQAIPRLKSALSDSDAQVRKTATDALKGLGKVPQQKDASSATEVK